LSFSFSLILTEEGRKNEKKAGKRESRKMRKRGKQGQKWRF